MIHTLVLGIVLITAVTTIAGAIHGTILITVQDGQAPSAIIGETPGITDGAWVLVIATIATRIMHGHGTLTTVMDIRHIRTTVDGDIQARSLLSNPAIVMALLTENVVRGAPN